MPKVSIIIPCYNQAEFLPTTLQSLQSQSLSDWECIIVNDGSTDNSADIIAQFTQQDPRFRLINKTNGGSATARNIGLKQAQGEYIQFLDADDLLAQDKLEKQTAFMDAQGIDFTYTHYCHFADTPQHILPHSTYTTHILTSFRLALLTRWGISLTIPLHAPLYRRSFILHYHLSFNETTRVREDWDWLLQVSRYIRRPYRFTNYIGAFYRANPHGKTSSYLKITEGNIHFLSLKAEQEPLACPLLAFRLSEELWLLAQRMFKYRSLTLPHPKKCNIPLLIAAIILAPLSFIPILIRTIRIYLLHNE